MKTIKKIYCRTFQTAFKIAGPILPYKDPQIIYNVEETYKILENLNSLDGIKVCSSFYCTIVSLICQYYILS